MRGVEMSNPFFPNTLKSLIGFFVGVFSNDGALIKGNLVDVKKDYLILQNKEGKYLYHYLSQIKSVSKNAKDTRTSTFKKDYLQAEQLQEILEQCKYSWITINCFNDQVITGFLSRVFEDHLILVSEEEQIIMQITYINNVFPGVYEPEKAEPNSQAEGTGKKSRKKALAKKRTVEEKEKQEEAVLQVEWTGENYSKKEKLRKKNKKEREQVKVTFDQKKNKNVKEVQFDDKQNDFIIDDRIAEKPAVELKKVLTDKQAAEKAADDQKKNLKDEQMEEKQAARLKNFLQIESLEANHLPNKEKEIQEQILNNNETEKLELAISLPIQAMEEKQKKPLSFLTVEETEKQLEVQYYSLMKQAEKKYMTLREKRMKREMLKK